MITDSYDLDTVEEAFNVVLKIDFDSHKVSQYQGSVF